MREPPHRCACGMRMVDFCMSQAAVGQRSAHKPQCTQTSSSFTMTRAGLRQRRPRRTALATDWSAGAVRRARNSASVPFCVMVRQSTGQMSMHASHSMHSLAANTVCTSQFKQRCTSSAASSAVNPSSTSMLIFLKRSMQPHVRHQAALDAVVFVLVGPLVHAHFAAGQAYAARQALPDRLVLAKLVDGNGGLVAMFHRPDDVLRAECRIAAEKHLGRASTGT